MCVCVYQSYAYGVRRGEGREGRFEDTVTPNNRDLLQKQYLRRVRGIKREREREEERKREREKCEKESEKRERERNLHLFLSIFADKRLPNGFTFTIASKLGVTHAHSVGKREGVSMRVNVSVCVCVCVCVRLRQVCGGEGRICKRARHEYRRRCSRLCARNHRLV